MVYFSVAFCLDEPKSSFYAAICRAFLRALLVLADIRPESWFPSDGTEGANTFLDFDARFE
jgi:hypothetical protein